MATKNKPTCAVPGCDRPAKTRGICGAHYIMQLKPGHPQAAAIRAAMLPSKTTGRRREVGGKGHGASGDGSGSPSTSHPLPSTESAAIASACAQILAALGLRAGMTPYGGGFLFTCGADAALLNSAGQIRKVLSITCGPAAEA